MLMLCTTSLRQALAAPLARPSLLALARGFSAAAPAGSAVVDVKDDAEFERIVKKGKFIAPFYDKLSQEHPTVKFTKVDIDSVALNQTVTGHGITGVPTFMLFKEGKRVGSIVGANLEELKKLVGQHK